MILFYVGRTSELTMCLTQVNSKQTDKDRLVNVKIIDVHTSIKCYTLNTENMQKRLLLIMYKSVLV